MEPILAPWQPASGDNETVRVLLNDDKPIWLELIRWLDAFTDKDFVFVTGDYDISISEGTFDDPIFIATADAIDGDVFNGKWDIVIEGGKIGSAKSYEYVARHELGHTMGLQHPSDDTITNTVMSYDADDYRYSDLDKAALIAVNGIEDDSHVAYRFYNKNTGSHTFTDYAPEAEMIATQLYDTFSYDGIAFALDGGSIELHRFYNPSNGAHFFSTDMNEGRTFIYEGLAFMVSDEGTPVYRYLNELNGAHLYTLDPSEAPDHYLYEGVGFYV